MRSQAIPAILVYRRQTSFRVWIRRQVLTLQDDMISTLTIFVPPTGPQLFGAFGLPLILPDTASAGLPSAPHTP
jgi:hypothetical protein